MSGKEAVSKSKGELMRSVNDGIASVAASLPAGPPEPMVWEFVCECGHPECTAWVKLELESYETIRGDPDRHVIAAGHVLRARRARARSQVLKEEASALRAQAQQLARRRRPPGGNGTD